MKTTSRLTHSTAAVIAALFTCAFAIPVLAQDCPELVGRLPGSINAVAVAGGYAYLASPTGLLIADVSEPSAPQLVGEVGLPSQPKDVAVSGSHAYVADLYDGLRVIDVSTPSAPVEVGFVDTPDFAHGVAVSGGYAYVAAGFNGLWVIDVSVPSTPFKVALLHLPEGVVSHVAVSADHAFLVGPSGFWVIDVSTPTTPVEVGFLETPGGAEGVAVSGSYAYLTYRDDNSGDKRFGVVDVSTPSAPVEVGFVDTPDFAHGVAVSGGYAYVAAGEAGVRVIDVTTPSAPVEVWSLETPHPDSANAVAASAGYAYVGGDQSFRVIDVGAPTAPVEVGFVDALPITWDVAVSGGYAYVAGYESLRVIDVSTPSAPFGVGEVGGFGGEGGAAVAVAVSGGYAFVVNVRCGLTGCGSSLHVIDVSTPSIPTDVGFVDFGAAAVAGDVAVADGYAYVASGGLHVIDVSTPAAPVEVGFLETPGYAEGVAVSGGYAYVVEDFGLLVIDVSTPTAPLQLGFVVVPSQTEHRGVAVSARYAYFADGPAGLRVIDVRTPTAPVEVGFVDEPANWIAVSRGYAYAADTWEGPATFRVIDVRFPSVPVEVGFVDGVAGPVAVEDGHVLVGGDGLHTFAECSGPYPHGRESLIPAAAVAAGAQGAFFSTDVEVNNTGAEEARVSFQWLPRGEDNSAPVESESIALAPGQSLRWENVLTEVFGLEPDSLGALKMTATTESVIGMSRTYNVPGAKATGTFGQGLPAIRATDMIQGTQPRRIIFLSEDPDSRANVGCVNGSAEPVQINIGLFNAEGSPLETKTMNLAPYSNDQINRILEDYAPVNGYVDVWADSDDAIYYCYGSMLDNETSDPTTILPQVPSADTTFIPAAALAAGLEGSFFETDVDLNNVGSTDLTYQLLWLPRGADNSDPLTSDTFSLAPGAGVRYANVLDEVFGLEADQVGALAIEASGTELLAMSRTYNLPSAKVAGTFGQELPGIPADQMIPAGVTKRIIFMSDNDDVRSNVGCVNGVGTEVAVAIDLYGSDGVKLETKYMMLPPYSNRQINGIFQEYAPVNGYVDVRTNTPGASIYCYGSVLDNVTSDPTTVLPQ